MDRVVRPPFAYYGGKTRIAPKIAALLPPHGHYVEPFAGSLAVLLAKPRATRETVNDLDGDLVTFWRVLRDQPDELARLCALTPHSRAEYEASFDRIGCDDLERARRVWAVLAQSRTSAARKGWQFRVDPRDTRTIANYIPRMLPAAERLAGVVLECRPAIEVIERYGKHPDVLIYADPPYLGETRSERRGYRFDMTDESGHRDLAAALSGCRATVVLSGYDSPVYADLYDGWHVHRIVTSTSKGGAGTERTEVLWSNRPLALLEEQPLTA